ncbi:unannotated protein [freshwater metagenome]|uniref:Unannotated protein n=1 Tax=freshwater metagenome TaxID=449393 RepID=A0A6J7XXS3_9ZZZZ|nr:NUDIX domain-containing protein [Actinomycetota bacterium]
MIRAAGAILWRKSSSQEIQVALIHRPKYDDWTFPKGTVDTLETPIMAAFREVKEETGYEAKFGRYLGEVVYKEDGKNKQVKYWAAQASSTREKFVPNDEVDVIQWVTPKEAKNFLSYADDRELIKLFRGTHVDTNTYVLLRHATAVGRGDWERPDTDRPLNELGKAQATALTKALQPFGIKKFVSSTAHRCISTLEPIARETGTAIELNEKLCADRFEINENYSIDFIKELLSSNDPTVICSHNPIIPHAIASLISSRYTPEEFAPLLPGDAWVLHTFMEEIVGLDFLRCPQVN